MTETKQKLFRVELRGMKQSHGDSYVIAPDPTSAHLKLKTYLKEHDLGFYKDRELDKITLIADSDRYGDCGVKLFL